MQYRKEIDGLRALAVMPVIFFHAGLLGMTGGYVGVDVFFVISGYLITSILVSEIEGGKFSIINFYERRARRILPALGIVLIFTTVAAVILMPPYLLKSYSQSLISVATFSSNVFFYLTSGYFSTTADEKPLLHTWSLAVEEQYYIFFPLLLAWLWFLGKRKLTAVIVALSAASLLLAQYLATKQTVDANFYLIFSRAWELFAGSLLAMIGVQRLSISTTGKNALGTVGLALIAYSIFFFDKHTPFPSLYTLIPVCGTVLVIAFSDSSTAVGKLLSNKLFVAIGLISYSLYLWHQPLFAFLRMKSIGEPGELLFVIAIVATFLLAWFSYKFVETPFRNKTTYSRTKIFQFSSAFIVSCLALGFAGHFGNGFGSRFNQNTDNILEEISYSPKRAQCNTGGENYLKPEKSCRYPSQNPSWAVFGDSHTVEPAYALSELLQPTNDGLLHLSFRACPPALTFEVQLPGCNAWVQESLKYLEQQPSITNVLIAYRFSLFLTDEGISSRLSDSKTPTAHREAYWLSFSEIIERLTAAGKTVYLLYPVPEPPVHIRKAIMPRSIFTSRTMVDLERTVSLEQYQTRNEFIIDKLDTLKDDPRIKLIKTADIFCEDGFCPLVINGQALYSDNNHLSVNGAKQLINQSVIGAKLRATSD